MRFWRRFLLGLLLLAAASAVVANDSEPPRLTFIKSFRGSQPEYVRVTVEPSGKAVYQGGSMAEPSEPETFQLSPATAERLFRLAAELDYFRRLELESGRQVAHLGDKLFRYQAGGEQTEVRFNYTENSTAQELQGWFERIARGRYLNQVLDYQLSFDRLGVPGVLREFEQAFNAGELVDPEQFLPVLERLAADTRVMRVARARARDLVWRIRSGQSRLTIEYEDQRSGSYAKLVMEEEGSTTYEIRSLGEVPQPKPLDVPRVTRQRLLELVREANYLRAYDSRPQGAGAVVGYRLVYEAGSEHNQVAFSQPPDAVLAEIVYLFQRLMYQQDLRERLQGALEEQSLVLQVVLQELEQAVRSNSLADPTEFLPLLQRISDGSQTHARVRDHAQRLLEEIRAGS
ncbi:MAG: hypothetical protein ACE5G6_02555 [Terriglobia bacterium]